MNVLIACEESQRVCTEFRERGHNAYSCDIQEPSGGHPEWHIKGDVLLYLDPVFDNVRFVTMDGKLHSIFNWDLIIANPPCTYLTNAGNRWFNIERYGDKARKRYKDREEAAKFFMAFLNAQCKRIAIENPIGYMSTAYRKPDQIIQPYEYGHPVRKSTCLWLKGLPKLEPESIVEFETHHSKGKYGGYSGPSWFVRDESGKILPYSDPRVARERSKTYIGIAKAMAKQWG